MRSNFILFLILIAIMLFGCDSDEVNLSSVEGKDSVINVLLLQVDYTTNEFEGGKEFKFLKKANDFTIASEYVEPSDFGSVKLTYKELNEPLFEGTIHWMGTGKIRSIIPLLST